MTCVCPDCSNDVALSDEKCLVCGSSAVGFQNVRAARLKPELQALDRRYMDAKLSLEARKLSDEMNAFSALVDESKAVMNRSLGSLSGWVNGNSSLFETYYKQIVEGRVPQDNKFDRMRSSVEAAIHQSWHQNISYAALSIDGIGVSYYGDYSLTLKTNTIERRATVFEENGFTFCEKHNLKLGHDFPNGYKAEWSNRSKLAISKLHSQLFREMAHQDYCQILKKGAVTEPDGDFIEVHIFGPIHERSIESVTGPIPKRNADLLIWRQVKRKLSGLGITLVTA